MTQSIDTADLTTPGPDHAGQDRIRHSDAVGFYRDVIGFDEHMLMPSTGMADLSAGGLFPHRLALNIWNGPHATRPPGLTHSLRR